MVKELSVLPFPYGFFCAELVMFIAHKYNNSNDNYNNNNKNKNNNNKINNNINMLPLM